LNSQPFTYVTASVAPRQLFFQTRLPVATSAAQVPSKQPLPSPALAKYTRVPAVSMSLTREVHPLDGSGTADAAENGSNAPVELLTAATAQRPTPPILAKVPPR
jgi:hypothetical protein